jgi:peptide deformylase
MLLAITKTGDPVLRQPARPLTPDEVGSPALQQLIGLMRDTLRDAPGVGLAAPQVGESVQLVVVEDLPEYMQSMSEELRRQFDREPVPFTVLANPVVVQSSGPTVVAFEGCLSVPGYLGAVARSAEVVVSALNEHGEPVTVSAHGWHARILQHEIDHLDGVLFVDRMLPRSLVTREMYGRYRSKDSPAELAVAFSAETPTAQ